MGGFYDDFLEEHAIDAQRVHDTFARERMAFEKEMKLLASMGGDAGAPAPTIPGKPVKDKAAEQTQKLIDALVKEAATFGQTAAQAKLYEIEISKAGPKQMEFSRAVAESITQMEQQKGIQDIINALVREAATFGMTANQIKLYDLQLAKAGPKQMEFTRAVMDSLKTLNDNKAALQEMVSAADAYEDSLISLATTIETEALTREQVFQSEIDQLQELMQAGLLSQDAFDWKRAQLEGEELDKQLENMTNGAREFGRAAEDAFTQLVLHGASLRETMRGLIILLAEMILKATVFNSISGLFQTGGALAGIGGFFGKLLQGKAGGGDVNEGTPYVVGERGPEIFMPDVSGAIVPHGKALGGQVVYNIDARGADAGVERRILRALKAVHGSAVGNAQLAMQDRMLRSGA